MDDESQVHVPESFVDLYRSPGRLKLRAPRADILERYGFCEDLAQLLTEHAKGMQFDLGIAESDVLDRCHLGLQSHASGVDPNESVWVVRRLAELLDWPDPWASGGAA